MWTSSSPTARAPVSLLSRSQPLQPPLFAAVPWAAQPPRSLSVSLSLSRTALPAAAVTQQEVEALYKRFRSLDRGRKVG